MRHLGGQGLDARDLVVAIDDPPVDLDVGQFQPIPAGGNPPLQVVLGVEGGNLPRVGVRLAIQEPDFFPVRQEHERYAELLGVVTSLILRRNGVDAGALGLDSRHGSPRPVAQRVVGPRAVRQRVLEEDAHAVREIPAGVLEKSVDLDARGGFGCWTHALAAGSPTCCDERTREPQRPKVSAEQPEDTDEDTDNDAADTDQSAHDGARRNEHGPV